MHNCPDFSVHGYGVKGVVVPELTLRLKDWLGKGFKTVLKLIETCQLLSKCFDTELLNGRAGVPTSCFLVGSSDHSLR